MPAAHFKQVAKQSRAVCKKFINEPFEEVEKQVVSIYSYKITFLYGCVGSRDRSKQLRQQSHYTAGQVRSDPQAN